MNCYMDEDKDKCLIDGKSEGSARRAAGRYPRASGYVQSQKNIIIL